MRWTWDKFGLELERTDPQPVLIPRIPQLILRCLKLQAVPGIQVRTYEWTRKVAVIVPAKEVNPTWQEIDEAAKRSGWSVEVFAAARFDRLKQLALKDFLTVEGISPELAESLVEHGYFTLRDFLEIDPQNLMQLGGFNPEQAEQILAQAEIVAELMEI
jgi:hypothetical protein